MTEQWPHGQQQPGGGGSGEPPYGIPPGSTPYGAPQQGPPQQGPPQQGPPQQGGPWYGAPQPGNPQYGGPQYGGPPSYPTTPQFGPGGEYLGAGTGFPPPEQHRPKGRRKMIFAGVAAAVVVALVAGGVAVAMKLAGSTTTLDKLAPADAIAYAEINLDPPAEQKIAAVQFLKHFPDVKVSDNSQSLVDGLIEPLITDAATRKKFADNIKPWLGSHAALVVDPQGDTAQPVLVVEATDPAKARTGMEAIAPDAGVDFVIDGHDVVIAETAQIAQRALDDAKAKPLADDATYQADIKAVGGNGGIITAWGDLGKAAAELNKATSGVLNGSALKSRFAARFALTSTTADLTVKTFGKTDATASSPIGKRLATLPEDTAFVAGLTGGGDAVQLLGQQSTNGAVAPMLQQFEASTGLRFPDDIAALLGSETIFAFGNSSDGPAFGMVSTTTKPQQAATAARKLAAQIGLPPELAVKQNGDTVTMATSPSYADTMSGNGTFGSSARVREAMPDLDRAQVVLYFDVTQFSRLTGEQLPPQVTPVQTVGLTMAATTDSATLRLRVVVG